MSKASKRRRQFPAASQKEQGEVCVLCSHHHLRTSTCSTWKDKSAQQCASSWGVDAESPVCRPCRDDISRLVKDPAYIPRWKKAVKNETCAVVNCSGKDIVYSTTIGITAPRTTTKTTTLVQALIFPCQK